ncbi:heavy-metal-associated domain-containing protein [Sulfolobus acidocaldarius]|uniref:heavy-metal-associated domain-containing protein n=1 Tax=Sulfolobus acidocaldarius TaxID=2285 RepID=UPI001E4BECBA|nr:heavy-metal-associated domain-containing protein [Sulfolobus acidocaldarius]
MDEFNKKEINNELRVMRFQVFDVECGNCVYKIKRALATLPDVVDINITPDFDNSKAVVILRYKAVSYTHLTLGCYRFREECFHQT